MAKLQSKLWTSTNFEISNEKEFFFKTRFADIPIEEDDSLDRVLEIFHVFRESKTKQVIELLLVKINKSEDQEESNFRYDDPSINIYTGDLDLKRKQWKTYFFVLQQSTLFWFKNESCLQLKQQPEDYVRIAGCQIQQNSTSKGLTEGHGRPSDFLDLAGTFIVSCRGKHLFLRANGKKKSDQWIHWLSLSNLRQSKVIAVACIEELESRGLDIDGLFRVTGDKETIEQVMSKFARGKWVSLGVHDDHVITVLIKRTIRELIEPLLTFKLYSRFCSLMEINSTDSSKTIDVCKNIVNKIPIENQGMVEYLMNFLGHVAKVHPQMNASNLAIVFAPNILRPEIETKEVIFIYIEILIICTAFPFLILSM